MNRLIKLGVAAVLLALPLAACTGQSQPTEAPKDYLGMSWDEIVAEAKNEGEVVFSAWWGEAYWKEAAKLFTEKYGIEARLLLGNNAIDKILAEKDRSVGTIDVQLIGGADVKTSFDAGLWYGPVFDKLPSSSALDKRLATIQEGVETKGHLVPIYRNQTAFLYDPDKVSTPPQTWDEFVAWVEANPKAFAYPDPNKGGTGSAFVQAVISSLTGGIDKYAGDSEVVESKVADWKLAWDWLKSHHDLINVTLSNSEDIDLLNQGAASLVIAWDDDSQAALTNGTLFKRAKMYVPEFGLPGGGDTAGVLKNAPSKAAAMLFLDFLTSPEAQALMNQTVGAIPARTDLSDVPSLIDEENKAKATPWLPAAYKEYLLKAYTENVLLN